MERNPDQGALDSQRKVNQHRHAKGCVDTMEPLKRTQDAEETELSAPSRPQGPSLLERGARAARNEFRAWRGRRKQTEPDDLFKQSKKDGATVGAAFKNGLIATAALIVPLGCAVIAFLAAGYYFNGGKDWNGDTASLISYGLAGLVEFGLLALLTASAVAFWHGKPWHFPAAGLFALPVVYVSTSAQLLYLSTHIDVSAANHTAQTLSAIPFVGYFLGGANGGAYILIARSCVTTVLEVACCYVLARATINTRKIIGALREKAQAQQELARYKRLEQLDKRLDQFAMAALDHFEALLDAGSTPLTLPNLLNAQESEAARNGTGTFPDRN